MFSKYDDFYIVSYIFRSVKNNSEVKNPNLFHWINIMAQKRVQISRFRESVRFWRVLAEITYLMKLIRIFDFTIALTESKYIGYGIKIVTFWKYFFRLLVIFFNF